MAGINEVDSITPFPSSFSMVWLKRDLRLRDHEPLCRAIIANQPFVIAYVIEPWQLQDKHFDIRHWRFIYESLQDLNSQLAVHNAHVVVCQSDIIELIDSWKKIGLNKIFSHQEVGLKNSFNRDCQLASYCKENNIIWQESDLGALKRPLKDRFHWRRHWSERILAKVHDPNLRLAQFYKQALPSQVSLKDLPKTWQEPVPSFQPGGEKRAWYTLKDFFKARGKHYFGNIGKPEQARKTCSRLSPYLTWGNISIKQVFQYTQMQKDKDGWQASIQAFSARLSWHCHFIQKFESEHEMEFRSVNKAYKQFPYDNSAQSLVYLEAWKQGRTGIPIIDASMLALIATGYLNFRMRAMLVSFLCHHLNIDWRKGVVYLGSLFLDFEPGIHYPQFQMQAGVTGTNTIRLYNPIKQSMEKDPEGLFIKKWLPNLAALPKEYIHEPHKIPPIEAMVLGFDIEKDYRYPIIDIESCARKARERLWSYRKRDDVKKEAKRVLYKHSVLT